jgi:hypothetical protein
LVVLLHLAMARAASGDGKMRVGCGLVK